jgi:hypothetical protein
MRHAVVLLCIFTSIAALSQANPAVKPVSQSISAKAQEVAATIHQLPVRQVVLYKNGIGYFEHLGSVTGNQRVAIDFTSSQLNDVLQSLTILDDNGGRIGGVNYNSTTPLAEQLKSLSLAMSDDPTSTELFQALRGQRVEVTGAPGGAVTGRLMSIEGRGSGPATSDEATDGVNTGNYRQPLQRFWLTVVSSAGAVRVIELTPSLSVRPLDASLQGQLDRYLELLSSTHSTGLRHLTLDALGQGPRQLHVSYISEVPVWKSTYRIVFPKDSTDKAILQGWAVVDNTIGSDWDNVQLSLVAGAPQSFIQPLSQPLYLRRPEVPISTTAQTTPQTHEAADMPESAPPQGNASSAIMQPQMMNNRLAKADRFKGGLASESVTVSADVVSSGSGNGYGPGSGGNVGGGVYRAGGVYSATNAINEGDVATNKFDDFFQYTLAQPVTIHKNESAMVPILQENLPTERVTLWSQTETTPFRAIWLENTSKLTFDRGSFSIFEGGVFAGQGLLDPIHPGEKRLLSYAADQAIRVREHPEESKRELLKIHIARGYIHLTYGAESKNTFIASNSAEEARVVVLEVPRQPNRDLASETKPAETTPTLYRFRLAVPAHQSASVLVADQGPVYEDWTIQEDADEVAALQRLADAAPALADRLKPIIAAQQVINQMKAQLNELQQRIATLTADEARARENLTALKGNDAGKRFVDELNRSEDQLESNRKQTADLNDKKKAVIDSLRQTIATLEIDWTAAAK